MDGAHGWNFLIDGRRLALGGDGIDAIENGTGEAAQFFLDVLEIVLADGAKVEGEGEVVTTTVRAKCVKD